MATESMPPTPAPHTQQPTDAPTDELDLGLGIALIGVSGRFPGADSVEALWSLLCAGASGLRLLSDAELRAAGVPESAIADPAYVRRAAVLSDIESFDAGFFGLSPAEARLMDPQQRLLLECAWEALEDAGHDPARSDGSVGVFVGARVSAYLLGLMRGVERLRPEERLLLELGNGTGSLATRIAYKLDLRGPTYALETACSTGLSALHLACQSLLFGECRMALVGAASIEVPQHVGYAPEPGGMVAPDGQCRPFDAEASGTVFGSGVGVVLLKRVADALADGDPIRAVVRGTAVNNDGARKASYTAPSVPGQRAALLEALASAGVEAETIGYFEAHGTGTPLGDPMEVRAATEAWRASTGRRGFCTLGSIKGNIGHLNTAAGIASLIKAALVVERGLIPPIAGLSTPSPQLGLLQSPFRLATALAPFEGPSPRRAAVSAFGFGGTNAHAILEAPPAGAPGTSTARPALALTVSGRTEAAADAACARLTAHLQSHPGLSVADVAHTLAVGRRTFEHRRAIVVPTASAAAAAEVLAAGAPPGGRWLRGTGAVSGVAFLFPGQGTQAAGMAAGLYEAEPVFRQLLDRCLAHLRSRHDLDLAPLLLAAAPTPGDEDRLAQTALAQPALFAISVAYAALWRAQGLLPNRLAGHSLGELVAAHEAGVFTLEDALDLVALRGRLMQACGAPGPDGPDGPGGPDGPLDGGAMLAIGAPVETVEALLAEHPEVELAAANGPAQCVVGGPRPAIERLSRALSAPGSPPSHPLRTSHAFHTAVMDPAARAFAEAVARVPRRAPEIPVMSCVTGAPLDPAMAQQPEYWGRQLRAPVRFGDVAAALLAVPRLALLEVGPGQVLTGLARLQPAAEGRLAIASQPAAATRPGPAARCAAHQEAVARLFVAGVSLDPAARFAGERRLRVPLPTYPFQRARHWVDAAAPAPALPSAAPPAPAAGDALGIERLPLEDWLCAAEWRSAPALSLAPAPFRLALLGGPPALVEALTRAAEGAGGRAEVVSAGQASLAEGLRAVRRAGPVAAIVDLRGLVEAGRAALSGLLSLGQALGERVEGPPPRLIVATRGAWRAESADAVRPEGALLQGAARVLPRELPGLEVRTVDVAEAALDAAVEAPLRLARALLAEALAPADRAGGTVVALRGARRLLRSHAQLALDGNVERTPPLRPQGRYLILGGLGGVGPTIAAALARACGARVALLGRTPLPPRSTWPALVAPGATTEAGLRRRVEAALRVEAAGGEVLALAADVRDPDALRAALAEIRAAWGGLDGVFHAAGVPGGALMALRTPEELDAVLAPKVDGVRALERALDAAPLDFVVLFSSITAVLGEMGQFDYAAANAYLDAYAADWGARAAYPVLAIGWDMWRGEGMAVDARLPAPLRALREAQQALAMAPEEGVRILFRALACAPAAGLTDVLVSTTPLAALDAALGRLTGGGAEGLLSASAPAGADVRDRPALTVAFRAPEDAVESQLCAQWERLLGLRGIGVDDGFFELGGHSLLAAQLRNQVFSAFQVDLPLRALFDAPTVAHVAALVRAEQKKAGAAAVRPIRERLREAFPTDRPGLFADYLRAQLERSVGEPLPADGALSGFDARRLHALGAELEYTLKQELGLQIFPHEVALHATVGALAADLLGEIDRLAQPLARADQAPLSAYPLRAVRQDVPGVSRAVPSRARRNPPMAFVQSSPRAGSTLFRVMLAGHPQLFCPPELNLLFFDSMRGWRDNVGFGHEMSWTEGGLQWAFMELLGLDSAAGTALLDELVARDADAAEVFGRLQTLCAPRLLVDKTPTYALDPETLARAEALFDGARHIFLHRHPLPVMESIVRTRMDRLFGPALFGRAGVDPCVVAEAVWALCNRTLLDFCASLPPERVHRVAYEALVEEPEAVMRGVCAFLEVPYDPRVVSPYDGKRERMMGGLGDPNILKHSGIEKRLGRVQDALRWPRPLDASTVALAARLGYDVSAHGPVEAAAKSLADCTPEEARRLLENLDALTDEQVATLLAKLEDA